MSEKYASAEEEAYLTLRSRILSGELPARGTLQQDAIGTELGLSRIPVRDAIKRLAAEGLVTIQSNNRAAVASLSKADLVELFEMRASFEGLAGRYAAIHITSFETAELQAALTTMDQVRSNLPHWLIAHDKFHDLISSAAKLPRLRKQLEQLRRVVHPFIRDFYELHHDPELRDNPHNKLLEAIVGRNADLAETLCKLHVREALSGMLELMDSSVPISRIA